MFLPIGRDQGQLTNHIELISDEKVSKGCTKAVKPFFGRAFRHELGFKENEGDSLGMTGQFAREAPIFCGGKNGNGNLKTCYEFDYNQNE